MGLSIDDFGTGFSSLSYLKRLPIDELKIDRSFVSHMLDRGDDFTIVRATIELGRNLGLRVVAEGVQDRETFDRLGDFGCDEAQGFYIAKPLDPEAFWLWLSAREAEFNLDATPSRATPPTSAMEAPPPPGDAPADLANAEGSAPSKLPSSTPRRSRERGCSRWHVAFRRRI